MILGVGRENVCDEVGWVWMGGKGGCADQKFIIYSRYKRQVGNE